MNKNKIRVITAALLVGISTVFASAAGAKAEGWWESFEGEYGTKLTRDWTFGLSDRFPSAVSDNDLVNFFAFRDELPKEVPLFAPYTDEEIAASEVKIYVSPDGNDSNPGTIEKPFKTVEKAIMYASNVVSRQGGMTIYLREGTYTVPNGMQIDEKLNGSNEHPTFISSYPGEKATVTTAMSIKGSQMKTVRELNDEVGMRKIRETYHDKVYAVSLKDLGYTDFGTFSGTLRPTLYIDGAQYQLARWPNAEYTGMKNYKKSPYGVVEVGDVTTAGGKTGPYTGDRGIGFEFVMSSKRPLEWENDGNIWMYGWVYEEWEKQHWQVDYFNPELNSVKSKTRCNYGALYQGENSYYFYNVLEEMDMPGEFYIDIKTGMLYLFPINDLADAEVLVNTTKSNGVTLNRTSHVVVNGITIDTVSVNGLSTSQANHCIVQDIEVKNCGNFAVYMSGANNGLISSRTTGNVDFASSDGATVYRYIPTRNFAQNNIINNGTIKSNFGCQDILSHNLVTGALTHAMYLNRCSESIFEYNEIVGGPNTNLDAGMIYNGGGPLVRNNHLRYNYLNRATEVIRNNPCGIYIDDLAGYTFSYGNISREARYHIHGGSCNIVWNNINIDDGNKTGFQNSDNYRLTAERWQGMVTSYVDNRWIGMTYSLLHMDLDQRNIHDEEYQSLMMQHQYELHEDTYVREDALDPLGSYMARPKYNWYENNLNVFTKNGSLTAREVKSVFKDNYSIDYDPGFEDYENGIYNISAEDLHKIDDDFEELPPQQMMGRVVDPLLRTYDVPVGKPSLISPVNTLDTPIYQFGSCEFTWTRAFGASVYQVELSTTPDFSNIVKTKRTQQPHAVVDGLETGKTYYWRVIVEVWTHQLDMTPVISETGMFRMSTEEEFIKDGELDVSDLLNKVDEFKEKLVLITEDYKKDLEKPESERVYTKDPEPVLNAIIDEKVKKINAIKLPAEKQAVSDDFETSLTVAWQSCVKPTTYDLVEENPNVEDWKVTGNATLEKNTDGLVIDTRTGDPMVMANVGIIRPLTTFKVRMKYDELASWVTIQLAQEDIALQGPTRGSSYFIVFKTDLIEFQRYLQNTVDDVKYGGVMEQFTNNNQFLTDNQWVDCEWTLTYTEKGPNFKFSMDGVEKFNVTDEHAPNYFFTSVGFKTQVATGKTYIAPVKEVDYAVKTEEELKATVAKITADYKKDLEKPEAERVYLDDPTSALTALVESKRGEMAGKKADEIQPIKEAVEEAITLEWQKHIKGGVFDIAKELSDVKKWNVSADGDKVTQNGTELKFTANGTHTLYTSAEDMLIRPNVNYKAKVKVEKVDGWGTLQLMQVGNTAAAPTRGIETIIVFKSDLIELQRYPRLNEEEGIPIVADVENNNTIIKPGEWFEIDYKLTYTDNGPNISFSIGGNELFNWTDEDAAGRIYDNLGLSPDKANGTMWLDVIK